MDTAEVLGEYRRLDPRSVPAEQMSGWIMFAVVMSAWAVGFALVWLTGEAGLRLLLWTVGLLGALLAPLLIWLATFWPPLSYRYASYRIDEQGIEIRRGVLIRTVTTVPRSRVQHTDVSQGPIERRFGLGTLSIYTAGTEFAQVVLSGLAYETAAGIRDMLLPKHGADGV
jgi:membrane protein YdbS with pleckstrin-like domain